jgi:hypothetical protein
VNKRFANLAIAGATLAMVLGGCGRHLPVSPVQQAPTGYRAMGTAHVALGDLMRQANAIVRKQCPRGSVYELNGKHHDDSQVDPTSYDSWVFGAADDDVNPANTIFLVYKHGAFAAPVKKHGFDYGRDVAEVTVRLDLHEAIAVMEHDTSMRKFDTVELYKAINPSVTQPYYIFSSETALVAVGAHDGAVTTRRPQLATNVGFQVEDGAWQ